MRERKGLRRALKGSLAALTVVSGVAVGAMGTASVASGSVPSVSLLGVGATTTWTTATSTTKQVAYPTSLTTSDFLLLVIGHGAADAVTAISTWTCKTSSSTLGTHTFLETCWRFWTGTTMHVTVTTKTNGTDGYVAYVAAFKGVTGTTPMDVTPPVTSASTAGATTFAPTGLTTATANALAISVVTEDSGTTNNGTLSLATVDTFTLSATPTVKAAGRDATAFAYRSVATAGAVTFPTWSSTKAVSAKAEWVGISLALRPGTPPKASPTLTFTTAPSTGHVGTLITGTTLAATLAQGTSPTGTITFKVFGPEASAPSTCSAAGDWTSGNTVTVGAGNSIYSPSAGFTPAATGIYWWYATYSPGTNSNNNAASSLCHSTSMKHTTVAKVTPSLTVKASPSTGTVGVPFTFTAFEVTLAGAYKPTSTDTITFKVFGPTPNPPTCSGVGLWNFVPAHIDPSNGSTGDGTYYAPATSDVKFTPRHPGEYWWFATYSGDTTKNNGQSLACNSSLPHTKVKTPITVTVTGTKTYGSTAASLQAAYTNPTTANVTITGTASCTEVTTGTALATAALSAGPHTLKSTTCDGLSLGGSKSGTYTIVYDGSTFTVNKAPIAVTVTGQMTYGTTGTETFSVPTTPPATVAFTTATLTCTEVSTGGGKAISSTLSAGQYTLTGSTCSGLTLTTTKAGDYAITTPYTGSTFTVNKATRPFDLAVTGFATTTVRVDYGSKVTFVVTGLTGLTGATVYVYTEPTGKTLCTFTLSTTVHSCSYVVTYTPATVHYVSAYWSGNSDYKAATSTNTVTFSDYSPGGGGGGGAPSAPTPPTPPTGAISHNSCSVASGKLSCANDTVTVTGATGPGALTVSQYASNPESAPGFSSTGEYFDVRVTPGSSFSSLSIKDCNLGGGTKLYWWNTKTASWEPVSPVSGPTGTPACLSATLSPTSVPTVSELTGTIFAVGTPSPARPVVTRVAGTTADATAAAELERTFDAAKGTCPASRSVVLATTRTYQDALSSQFLAGSLTTGTLLTPSTSLSALTAAALKEEGITTVYVVGGSLAVSTAVVKAIEALTAYGCGATSPSGKITVQRIAGSTAYGTAMAVAEHVGTAASLGFAGAYAAGKYNDTGATGTAAPSGSVPTAILASGQEFQDAQAASVISYATKLPLLLTPSTSLSTTAVAAIEKLGIKQVILLGGPLAVTDAVEQALVAKTGVSVLRIAGKDYSDTSAEIARFEVAGSTAGLGWTPGHRVMVARGNGFTDGLAGAVLENSHNATTGAAGTKRPLLLTESPTVIGASLATFLKGTGHTGIDGTAAKTVTSLTVLGGTLAVSTAVVAAMQTDLTH